MTPAAFASMPSSETIAYPSMRLGFFIGYSRSLSGKLTKISTPRITVAMRNAASCPFQTLDCHMAKYSPTITMKPKNQRPKQRVNPATPLLGTFGDRPHDLLVPTESSLGFGRPAPVLTCSHVS